MNAANVCRGYATMMHEHNLSLVAQGAAKEYKPLTWIVQHGIEWTSADAVKPLWKGRQGECFKNAAELAIDMPDRWVYVEGYGCSIIPTHHAWCMSTDGKAICDPTWWGRKGTQPPFSYFGIPINRLMLRRLTALRKRWGLFFNSELDFGAFNEEEERALIYRLPDANVSPTL